MSDSVSSDQAHESMICQWNDENNRFTPERTNTICGTYAANRLAFTYADGHNGKVFSCDKHIARLLQLRLTNYYDMTFDVRVEPI